MWRSVFTLVCLASAGALERVGGFGDSAMTMSRREELRDEVVEAFRHAYGSYMAHAYPADELMPLSCRGRGWERRTRGTIDDALGGYALTMVDSLDMHAVIGDGEGFREATATLLEGFGSGILTFDRDVVVSVFEASIRVLGGLLSAHQIATELGSSDRLGPPGWYNGELLPLAYDLGKRLLKAFDTPLGIPVHRVNLRKGIPRGETRNTCSAAAGTFLVEFGALSRLTGDPSFETAARRAVRSLWQRRSPLGLVGGGVQGSTGQWESKTASIGAGTDSFYEYLDKSAKLFRDQEMEEMFREAYAGVEEHLRWGRWHVEMDMYKGKKGKPSNYRISSLQAFWPAVQAGKGDVRAAERTYDTLFELWKEYDALPDFYDVLSDRLLHYGRDSPLRPEMAESTLALYRSTGSTKYLRAGEALLGALQAKSRVACGYASVGDVETGVRDDRMDSFFIAETLKYLFLLFDGSLPSGRRKSIFCTPDQEEDVVRHHAQRTAAPGAATAPAAITAANITWTAVANYTVGSLKSSLAAIDGKSFTPVVPFAGTGRTGDDEDSNDAHAGPQCLLWSATVLSTEGHPFLVSAMTDAVVVGGDVGADGAGGGNGGSGREATAESEKRPPRLNLEPAYVCAPSLSSGGKASVSVCKLASMAPTVDSLSGAALERAAAAFGLEELGRGKERNGRKRRAETVRSGSQNEAAATTRQGGGGGGGGAGRKGGERARRREEERWTITPPQGKE